MKSSRSWIIYSLLRIGLFAAVLALLLFLDVTPWLAAIIAAVVGLCVTYIFFRKPREAVVRSFYEYRTSGSKDVDADSEDDVLDSTPAAPPAQAAQPSERERGSQPDAEQQGRDAR
ncbi:DUF4229 domain-containing protein [Marisediminicola senii]|uniref:DUF4229 domain-containing protein n=1 Tax=Marisediminicola senii TaxID=2711233 RepID=UPI0013EA9E54|nr:DUF4229 domain-containing protein [Marisediminicola senii]